MTTFSFKNRTLSQKLLAVFVFLLVFFGTLAFAPEAQAQIYCDTSAATYSNQFGFCNDVLSCSADGTSVRCVDPAVSLCAFNQACVLPPAAALTINSSATPAPVNPGDSITIGWFLFGQAPDWTTPDHPAGIATACTASGVTGWSGPKSFANGFYQEPLTAPLTPGDYTYEIACAGLAGVGTETITLTVSGAAGSPQCSDGMDNDGDTLDDIDDPGCHTDGNAGNAATYDPNDDDESNGATCIAGAQIHMSGENAQSDCNDIMADMVTNGVWDCPVNLQTGDLLERASINNKSRCFDPDQFDVLHCQSGPPYGWFQRTCGTLPACSDFTDNDGDGLVDSRDPGCHTDGDPNNIATYDFTDADETDAPVVCTTGPVVNLAGFGPAFPEWDTCEYATLGDNALLDMEPANSVSSFTAPCRDYMCIDCMSDVITYKGIPRRYVDITCGGAAAPAIDVSPVDLDFGDVETGSSRNLSFVVSNTGGGTLNVDANPVITGAFDSNYQCISANCSSDQAITPGTPQTYTVQYAPTAVSNNQTATLTLTGSNFANQPITLTGNGTASSCSWNFPVQVPGNANGDYADCDIALIAWGFPAGDYSFDETNSSDAQYVACTPAVETTGYSAIEYACDDSIGWSQESWTFADCSCGGPPPPTANFTSPLAVSVDSGNNVTVDWTSSNADNCELYDTTNNVTLSGLNTADSYTFNNVTADTEYSVRCQNASSVWSANSDNVVVTINAPATCMLGSRTLLGETTQSDCENAAIADTSTLVPNCPGAVGDTVLVSDWTASQGGSVGACLRSNNCAAGSPNYSFIDSCGAAGIVGCTDAAANNQTPGATIEDGSCTYDPTATLEVSVNGGAWTGVDQTIDVGDTVEVRWDSTSAVNCTGNANVPTGGATDSMPAGIAVAEPAAGSFLDYTVTCDDGAVSSPPDTVRVNTNAQPNLDTPTLISETSSGVIDPVTGNFTYVDINIGIENFDAPTGADFTVQIELDPDGAGPLPFVVEGSYLVSALGVPPANTDISVFRLNQVPFGGVAQARITADLNNDVPESDEFDNVLTTAVGTGAPVIDMDLTIIPSDLVRGGQSAVLDWDTNASFDMECRLDGPALPLPGFIAFNASDTPVDTDGPVWAGPIGTVSTEPITSKSVYTLTCVEQISGFDFTFTAEASIETTGTVEEI